MSFPGTPLLTRRQLREQEARRANPVPPVEASQTWLPAEPPRQQIVVVRQPPARKKRAGASSLLSAGALVLAAALLVGMSVPANAFISDDAMMSASGRTDGQSVEVSDTALGAEATRANFTVTSYAELLRARYGNRNYSYTVGTGPIQWPFPYAVPISDGFGERIAPCRGCSTFHKGTDFTPGAGTATYAIADGVVIYTEVSNYGYGNHVIIEHTINGVKVQSIYAHFLTNSIPVHVGETVKVGDFVGLVGDTGASVGAHLHLEIHVDGVAVDPFAWLQEHAA